jgi:putative FmdB family regulatory protein
MPVYTYRCENCGVQFDRQQSYHDAALQVCPECRKKALKKVISPVGIVFKGSGFYSTDHKPTAGNNTAKAAAKKEEKESKEKEAKKDTKASEKSE